MSGRLRPNETDLARFIVNPRSAGGGTQSKLDDLKRSIDRYFVRSEVVVTEGPGHATELARKAVDDGVDLVVAVGGDGTASETVAGLFQDGAPRSTDISFTVVPAGTGSDFVRSLGMPNRLDDAVRLAAFGPDRLGDAVVQEFIDHDGEDAQRVSINVTGFGMNGDTVQRANKSSKRLGGTLTFFKATMGSFFSYRPAPVRITWTDDDGADGEWEGKLLSCFVANGAWCGGGMCVGPGGSLTDGAAELTIIPELGTVRTLALTPHLYRGTCAEVPGVVTSRIVSLRAESTTGSLVPVDVDGEQPGGLPLSITILAKAVRLRGVW